MLNCWSFRSGRNHWKTVVNKRTRPKQCWINLSGQADPVFFQKIHVSNFSKAVGCDANPDPDPRVRIRKKIHQNRKMQMILDPDVVRIRESYQTEWECIWIRILESGFRNFYADPRFASDPYHTVRTPFSGSDWARTSHVCKGYPASRSSVRTRERYAL